MPNGTPCITANGQYVIADTLPPGAFEVPPRPSDDHDWIDGAWVDTGASKKALGAIPTDVFLSTVFAAPEGAPTDYTWNRESVIRMLSPAVSVRMPKGGMLHGTRAEVLQMAGWMLTYAVEPNTYPPVFTPLSPNPDGTFSGGIISQDEYNRVLPLLGEYGVV